MRTDELLALEYPAVDVLIAVDRVLHVEGLADAQQDVEAQSVWRVRLRQPAQSVPVAQPDIDSTAKARRGA